MIGCVGWVESSRPTGQPLVGLEDSTYPTRLLIHETAPRLRPDEAATAPPCSGSHPRPPPRQDPRVPLDPRHRRPRLRIRGGRDVLPTPVFRFPVPGVHR